MAVAMLEDIYDPQSRRPRPQPQVTVIPVTAKLPQDDRTYRTHWSVVVLTHPPIGGPIRLICTSRQRDRFSRLRVSFLSGGVASATSPRAKVTILVPAIFWPLRVHAPDGKRRFISDQ